MSGVEVSVGTSVVVVVVNERFVVFNDVATLIECVTAGTVDFVAAAFDLTDNDNNTTIVAKRMLYKSEKVKN